MTPPPATPMPHPPVARRAAAAVSACMWLLGLVGMGTALLHLDGSGSLVVDWSHPGTWLARTPPDVALAALARLGGIVAVSWVVASSLLYLGVRLAGVRGSRVGWLSIGPVRRLVETVLAGSFVLAGIVPALARPDATTGTLHPTTTVTLHPTTTGVRAVHPAYVPVPAGSSSPSHRDERAPAGPTSVRDEPASLSPGPVVVVVRPGDHLWGLAERRLRQLWGRRPRPAEIAHYWVATVAANEDRLRSGDPDLVYPGEEIVLPATPVNPGS
jgi:hypothetical protein